MTAASLGIVGRQRSVLITVSLVSSLIMLDSNVVAVALPAIGQAFHADFTSLQWVISAYVLTYAALLMGAGSYADLRGRRHAMVFGLSVFALSSAACGLAPSILVLNLARAVQGVGGALLLTASMAIVGHDFAGEMRAKAMAIWGAAVGIALAMGPIAGGLITHLLGWRWVFLVNLPLSMALIAASLRLVSESKDDAARRLDFPGVVSFSAALAMIIWALNQANTDGWTSLWTLLRLGCGFALLAIFLAAELRQTRPMVDLGLFGRRTFLGSVAAMVSYGAGAQVMVFFLPMMLEDAYGFEPLTAGFAMLPFAAPMVMAPRYVSRLAERFSGRALLTAGLLIAALGDVLFWAVAETRLPYLGLAGAMIVAGCGAGVLNGQTIRVLVAAAPADRAGMASGLASTTRYTGILLSVAAMGGVLAHQVASTFGPAAIGAGLDALASARRVAGGDLAAVLAEVPDGLRASLASAGLDAVAKGFASASLLGAAIASLGAILTAALVSRTETAPSLHPAPRHCKIIDCRDPI